MILPYLLSGNRLLIFAAAAIARFLDDDWSPSSRPRFAILLISFDNIDLENAIANAFEQYLPQYCEIHIIYCGIKKLFDRCVIFEFADRGVPGEKISNRGAGGMCPGIPVP
jgi:hypothetical protein